MNIESHLVAGLLSARETANTAYGLELLAKENATTNFLAESDNRSVTALIGSNIELSRLANVRTAIEFKILLITLGNVSLGEND